MWNSMHFIGYKHRTRKEEKMQREQKEIVVSTLLKYIMEMSVKDCKFQQDKMKPSGKVVIPLIIIIPFCTHTHHQCIVGRGMYVGWRNTLVLGSKLITGHNRKNRFAVVPFEMCSKRSAPRKKERRQQGFTACLY